ncbi:MBL fold metallo-hydrolase [candidate division WS5 bacterium]|uniref:MBL fold metallo-hydrolase n=1 Tax=candidate division WS5 bacterium TaxID=2093353 RepID=A0A419DG17_9BACT|nr:MAG: MBL fold metallo-hydrolase [candidate division WS5 bacterium]
MKISERGACLEQRNKTRKIFSPIALLVLLAAFLGIWISVFASSEKNLEVTFFDVGQGDSALIEFPDGKNALIDGGPDKKVLEGLGKEMPFYRRKLDIIFLSHPHADHLAGIIHVMKRYEVGRIVMTDAIHTSPEYEEFLKIIKEKNIPVTKTVQGTEFDFGNSAEAKILYHEGALKTENLNDTSAIIFLNYQESGFLFMGDLEKDASGSILTLNPELSTDVIKVPHHGSQDAFNENLYQKTGAKYAVISVGANKYGHPYPPLLDFFQNSNIKLLRTDQDGNIEFVSDGRNLKNK